MWTILPALPVVFGCLVSAAALAADAAPDKSQYSVFNPTPDSALRTFTPDRPAKATSPITLDAGHVQIESDFLNYSFTRQSGTATQALQALDPVVKLGITSSIEFDVMTSGLLHDRSIDDASGRTTSRNTGVGDTVLQTKFNLLGNDGGDYAFALIPYLRVPTGDRHFGAGQVEGGLIAPLSVSLPYDFAMVLQTEVDALHNANTPGTHINFTNILNVSHAVPGVEHLTAIAEFYSSISTETRTIDAYTFDVALAYLVTPDVQLDIGSNIGLSRSVPDYQVYTGVAHRF